jgi:two-component system, response regulator PdtaR
MTPMAAPRRKRPRILLVEDEVLIRSLFSEALRDAGCVVIEAGCADDALACVRAGAEIDLVFSDVRMPGAFDGMELARQLGSLKPSLPVILTSGNLRPEDMGEIRFFLPKPYRMQRAVTAVFEVLGLEPPKG